MRGSSGSVGERWWSWKRGRGEGRGERGEAGESISADCRLCGTALGGLESCGVLDASVWGKVKRASKREACK